MYGCESWTVKKAEHRRIDAFELWCGRRLLRVPWTARKSNQSILKEISPGISLEGLMLKLKLSSCDDGGATWFFSSYGGILELRPGIQDASCVGPGKSHLPFELRRKAGDCSRVTAGPIDLI